MFLILKITSESLDTDYATILNDDLVIDEILVAGTTYHKGKKRSAYAKHLSKTWKILQETAQRIIDSTIQRCVRQLDPSMTRKFSTNDRMLRYKMLDEYFYMDKFYATKAKSMESIRQNTCSFCY